MIKIVLQITVIIVFLCINMYYSPVYARFLFFGASEDERYVPPIKKDRFYDRNGYVNADVKYQRKRINPEDEKIIVPPPAKKIVLNDNDFAMPIRNDFYQKNGLVNVSKKYRESRFYQTIQLPFLYGRTLYQGSSYVRYRTVTKPAFDIPFPNSTSRPSGAKRSNPSTVVSPR